MSSRYAEKTDVTTDRSRAEIERVLRRYGATQFMYGWDTDRAVIGFAAHGRQVRFVLDLPDPGDAEFTQTETGRPRSESAARGAYDTAVRQRWRVLALVVKAKMEAVESGLVAFEDEFLAHIVLPGGVTVGDTVRARVAEAYDTGEVPALMPNYPRALPAARPEAS
jgi:hypothetical protein